MDFARHVKSQIDIVRVVGDYVRLKKQGSQRWAGLCPFHTEKTPSFSVHEGHQFFKCFGCGKGGDVFNFLMELEGMSFFEALQTLCEQHGIPLPKRGPEALADEQTKMRSAVYQMHEVAQRFFRQQLESTEGTTARDYLARRGLPPEAIEEFGLGFAPSGGRLAQALQREGFSTEQIEVGGLVAKSQEGSGYYDRFRSRLMFPITNETGKLIAFAGRALDDQQQPKYLNSPESPIYKKSQVLYNLHRARAELRKRDRAVLVEGYMDVIGVWRAGVKEVVASCGTALSAEQVRMLKRHAPLVAVNFDPDAAGRAASERSILLLLDEGLHVRVVSLPEGQDPDEFCRKQGAAAYEAVLAQSPNYYFWLADRARQRYDTRTAEGRVAAFQAVMPAINRLSNKIERVALVNDVADRLGVEPGLVLENFRRAAAERREPAPAPVAGPSLKPVERVLLRLLLESAEARDELLPAVSASESLAAMGSANIFRALASLAAAGERFDLAALEARLGEADRRLLAAVAFDASAPPALEDGRQALRALEFAAQQARLKALHRQILDAQKSGNLEEALRLLRLKQQMESRHSTPNT
jgi:DNA primase